MANTDKIFIAEIADNLVHYRYFPFYQNVWGVVTTNIYDGIINEDFTPETLGVDSDLTVISFQVRNIPYLKVETVAEVIALERTFHYDITTRQLLVHFDDHKVPYEFTYTDLEIGFVIGMYKTPRNINGRWNNVQYYNRLKSTPVYSDKKDDLYYGKQSFPGASIAFENGDLRFKNFNIGSNIRVKNGNYVRTLIWEGEDATQADYDDFAVTFQGVIEKTREGQEVSISARDIRTSLNLKTPNRYLDTSEYTDIKNPDKQYILPHTWGKVYNIPCVCLNENVNKGIDPPPVGSDVPKDYTFLICDTAIRTLASDSIKRIFIDGTEIDATLPTIEYNTSQDIAFFTLSSDEFKEVDTDDLGVVSKIRYKKMSKLTIDIEGYLDETDLHLIENGLEVIRKIILDNYEKEYISTYYDLTAWAFFENIAYDVGYYINKPTTVIKQIGEISNSQLGTFLWNPDLRFSFTNDDFREYVGTINKYQYFPATFFPKFSVDGTEVLATFRVGYNKEWSVRDKEESHEWYVDETNQENALTAYNSEQSKDFITLLSNSTDVIDFAGRVSDIGSVSVDLFEISVPWEYYSLKAGEWITIEADLINEDYLGIVSGQVQSVVPNIDNWQVKLSIRVFTGVGVPLLDNEDEEIIDNNNLPILGSET
jgi:hypothetical protein